MAQPSVKTSFASGEWAPKLRSRVDIQKYHSGASLLRNFYVDYSGGGASTRPGTRFCNQAFKSATPVRIIPFQPSTATSYVLEFGDRYIRFFNNGNAILEASITVTGATGNTVTAVNSYSPGDWVFINGVGGITNINGRYFIVATATGAHFTVTDLFSGAVTFSGAFSSNGTSARVYTLASPFAATDLFPNPVTANPGIKFVQDVTSLIICHPSYAPQILTIIASNNWTISAINFGPTIGTPTNLSLTSTDTGGTTWEYAYLVTAVDANGQESATPAPATFAGTNLISSTAMANTLTWTAVSGAMSYNVYKATPSFKAAVPVGAQFGFIANVTGTSFIDSEPGIGPDFSQTPPITENPFSGSGVASYTVTVNGVYTTVPTVSLSGGAGTGATAQASLGVTVATINNHSNGTGDIGLNPGSPDPNNSFLTFNNGVLLQITSTAFQGSAGGEDFWNINSVAIVGAGGSITSGSTPSNPFPPVSSTAPGFQGFPGSTSIRFNFTWGVTQVLTVNAGSGYTSAPSVAFSAGAAAATAVLSSATGSNPGVPGFIQERLTLGGLQNSPQSFDMSQPGSFFNFNTTNPVAADDAINAQIISESLNNIKSFLAVPTGLLAFTGATSWLINAGGGLSTQNAITPANVTAQVQSFTGANDIQPLKVNFDALYVTNKGNYVRDLNYNIYAGIFTGSDISVISNHLFFNYYLIDWCWAEEPFKTIWTTRSDGTLLSLAYVKEQELIGWAHHDTNGMFQSTCRVYETVNGNVVDAVYFVVQRFINSKYVQYVERMADRFFGYGYEDSWSVDCALQTTANTSPAGQLVFTGNASVVGNTVTLTDTADAPFTATMATNNWIVRAGGGIYKITGFTSASIVTATVSRIPTFLNQYTNTPFPITGFAIWQPVTTVTGLTQLVGQSVTGVADGAVVPTSTVSASGSVTLASAATKITLGLAFTPQLTTLPLDLGEPTVQGKRKKIVALTLRVADTLGLQAGTTFANAVTVKDLTFGNLNVPTNATIGDLFSGDGRIVIDQYYSEPGTYSVQQNLPYPATILGVFPEVSVGDTK